jgi:hypothetical protein
MSDFNTPAPPPPPGYGLGAGVPANHPRAVLILVLGILSITCCGIFTGIPAFFMGKTALAEIDASGGTIGGRGMVQAGWICSIVGMVLFVVGIIAQIALRAGS